MAASGGGDVLRRGAPSRRARARPRRSTSSSSTRTTSGTCLDEASRGRRVPSGAIFAASGWTARRPRTSSAWPPLSARPAAKDRGPKIDETTPLRRTTAPSRRGSQLAAPADHAHLAAAARRRAPRLQASRSSAAAKSTARTPRRPPAFADPGDAFMPPHVYASKRSRGFPKNSGAGSRTRTPATASRTESGVGRQRYGHYQKGRDATPTNFRTAVRRGRTGFAEPQRAHALASPGAENGRTPAEGENARRRRRTRAARRRGEGGGESDGRRGESVTGGRNNERDEKTKSAGFFHNVRRVPRDTAHRRHRATPSVFTARARGGTSRGGEAAAPSNGFLDRRRLREAAAPIVVGARRRRRRAAAAISPRAGSSDTRTRALRRSARRRRGPPNSRRAAPRRPRPTASTVSSPRQPRGPPSPPPRRRRLRPRDDVEKHPPRRAGEVADARAHIRRADADASIATSFARGRRAARRVVRHRRPRGSSASSRRAWILPGVVVRFLRRLFFVAARMLRTSAQHSARVPIEREPRARDLGGPPAPPNACDPSRCFLAPRATCHPQLFCGVCAHPSAGTATAGDGAGGGRGVVELEPADARDVGEEDGDASGEHPERVLPVVLAPRLPVPLEAPLGRRGHVPGFELERELTAAVQVLRLLLLADVRLAVAEDGAQHERAQHHGVEHQGDDEGGEGVRHDQEFVHVRGVLRGPRTGARRTRRRRLLRDQRAEVGDGLELFGFLLDVAAVLLRVPKPHPPRVLRRAARRPPCATCGSPGARDARGATSRAPPRGSACPPRHSRSSESATGAPRRGTCGRGTCRAP